MPIAPEAPAGSLTVIVPAFDEAGGIEASLRSLRSQLPDAEIIVVDDGSQDGTASRAGSVQGVQVVRHHFNSGYGASIKTGLELASGDYVAWFDADGQHDAGDLAAMVRRIQVEHLAAVIGQRPGGSRGPLVRIVGKALILALASSLDVSGGPDLNCGLRVFQRDVLRRYAGLLPNGFSASLTTTTIMIERRYPFAFHPIAVRARVGTSKVRVRDGFSALMQVLRMMMLLAPLRIFLRSGVVATVVGLVYGVIISVRHGAGVPTASVLLTLSGLMLCMLGLIADQISQLRLERMPAARHFTRESSADDTSRDAR